MFERARFWFWWRFQAPDFVRQLDWRDCWVAARDGFDPFEPLTDRPLRLTPEELAAEALETARKEANDAFAAVQEAEQSLARGRASYRALQAAGAKHGEEPTVRAELSVAREAGREVAAAARAAAKRAAEAQKRVASLEAAQRAPLVAALEAAGMKKDGEAELAAAKTWDQWRAEAGWTPEERMAERRLVEAERKLALLTPGAEAAWAAAQRDFERANAASGRLVLPDPAETAKILPAPVAVVGAEDRLSAPSRKLKEAQERVDAATAAVSADPTLVPKLQLKEARRALEEVRDHELVAESQGNSAAAAHSVATNSRLEYADWEWISNLVARPAERVPIARDAIKDGPFCPAELVRWMDSIGTKPAAAIDTEADALDRAVADHSADATSRRARQVEEEEEEARARRRAQEHLDAREHGHECGPQL